MHFVVFYVIVSITGPFLYITKDNFIVVLPPIARLDWYNKYFLVWRNISNLKI